VRSKLLSRLLTDRVGARVVVSLGLVIAVLGTFAFTRVGPGTSYLYLASPLFVLGLGIGSTIMPSMAAAFGTLSREETPGGTSAINVVQRIAGATGTALMAVVLQRAIAGRSGARAQAGDHRSLRAAPRAARRPLRARAGARDAPAPPTPA
jgi:fucose permease